MAQLRMDRVSVLAQLKAVIVTQRHSRSNTFVVDWLTASAPCCFAMCNQIQWNQKKKILVKMWHFLKDLKSQGGKKLCKQFDSLFEDNHLLWYLCTQIQPRVQVSTKIFHACGTIFMNWTISFVLVRHFIVARLVLVVEMSAGIICTASWNFYEHPTCCSRLVIWSRTMSCYFYRNEAAI